MKKEKYIGESKLSEQPKKKLTLIIDNEAVTTAKIADGAVTTEKLSGEDDEAGAAVVTSKIADSAVTTKKIEDGAVTTDKLSGVDDPGGAAITTEKIADGAVTSAKIFSGAVNADKIASGAVHTENLGIGAVQSIHIAKDAVTTEKIFPFTVSEDKIKNYNVTTDKISGSVDPVTGEWTTPPAVTENKIAAGAVTEGKIAGGAVTNEKLAPNSVVAGNIDDGAVQAGNIVDGAITAGKIAANAVVEGNIAENAVTTAKIADRNVTTAKIADYNVTEAKLADGAVTMAKLADDTISKMETITDATPIEGSVKPIQSGGVQVALMDRAIVGDIVGDPAQAWEPGTAEAYIDQKIAEQNAVLNAKMSRQDAVIHTLNGQDIVLVSALPQTGEANKIYRLTGADSYTDYMWDTSLATPAFTPVATYGFPGIDEEPQAGSENLVKSSGVTAFVGRQTVSFNSSALYTKVIDGLNIKIGEKFIIRITSDVTLTRCIVAYNSSQTANRFIDKTNITEYELEITAPAAISSFYVLATSDSVANVSLIIISGLNYDVVSNRVEILDNSDKLANVGYFKNSSVHVTTYRLPIFQNLSIKAGEKIAVKISLDNTVTRLIISTDPNHSERIINYESSAGTDVIVSEYVAISDIDSLYIYGSPVTNANVELFSRYAYDTWKKLEEIQSEDLENRVETLEDTVEINTDEITKINEDIYTKIPVWELVASPQITAQGFINISNGNVAGYPSYNYVADYINVEGTDFVKLVDAGNTSSSAGYVFYTKNGETYTPILPGANQIHGIVIAVPAGATHIRFSTALNYTSPKIYKQAFVEQLTTSRLRGSKIVCFGDSITEFTDKLGKSYSDHMADMTGATVINVGIGGSYYRERTTPELNPSSTEAAKASLDVVNMVKSAMDEDFTYQVNAANYLKTEIGDDNTAIITRLSQIDWSTVDIVTFFAGTNDWNNSVKRGVSGDTDPKTTLGAINTIIQEICTNYPAIKIYFFTPVVRWLNYSGGTGDPADFGDNFVRGDMTLRQFCKFISDEILLNHIPVYDSYNLMGWNMYNFSNYFVESDGTHPYKGFGYIAQKFVSFLEANY